MKEGKKIDAIKALRQETGIGLKDAKEMIENALLEYPDIKLRYDEETKRGVVGFFLFLIVIIIVIVLVKNFF